MEVPQETIQKIRSLPKPVLIGISGFGGSGKSTLAKQLASVLNTPVVSVDSFVRDRTMTDYKRCENMDFSRLEEEVLAPFSASTNPISYGHFDWGTNGVVETRTVNHDGFLIVEGVGLFRPELLKYFTYKIWVECPLEEATERGKKRDREVHKNPQDKFWDGPWKQSDKEYYEAYRPKEVADLVVSNC